MVFLILTRSQEYVDPNQNYCEKCYCGRVFRNPTKKAVELGLKRRGQAALFRYQRSCSTSSPKAEATLSSVALRGCLTRSI